MRPQRIRITKCSVPGWWYQEHLGQEIDIDFDLFNQYKIDGGASNLDGYRVANTPHNQEIIKVNDWINMGYIAIIDYEIVVKTNRDAVGFLKKE